MWEGVSFLLPRLSRISLPQLIRNSFQKPRRRWESSPYLPTPPPRKIDAAQDRAFPPSRGTKARPLRSAPTAVFHEYKEPSQPNRLFEGTPCFSCGLLELQTETCKKSKKKKKKKKRIRFSQELPGKMRLVFFQYQVLEGLFAGFPFFFICWKNHWVVPQMYYYFEWADGS